MARLIFFLIDGIADYEKNYKTPLRLAKKPNIDKVLKKSFLAQFQLFTQKNWPKIGASSLTAISNLRILGYNIREIKRGPLEALGSDIKFQNKINLALRVDFASVNNELKVIDRRVGRNIWGLDILVNEINKKIKLEVPFFLKRTYGHRGVLIFRKKLSQNISNSDPLSINKKVKKIKPLKKDSLSIKTAEIVQQFLNKTYIFLKDHPINKKRETKGFLKANYILTREAGNFLPNLKNFFSIYKFKNGIVIAENGVVKGGCKLVGFKSLTLPELNDLRKRYDFYIKNIILNFSKFDLIYVHIKEADEASHDKNFEKKKKFFEFFDNWFGTVYNYFPKVKYIITGDHITNSKTGKHQFGNIPILIINHKSNNPSEFSEKEMKNKPLIKPRKLWNILLDKNII